MSTKKETIESVSDSIVRCQSQPPKPSDSKDTRGPPKLQIPPNLKWNPSYEIGQNDIVVTPCSFQPETIDCHDSKYSIVFDISYFNNIFCRLSCYINKSEEQNSKLISCIIILCSIIIIETR